MATQCVFLLESLTRQEQCPEQAKFRMGARCQECRVGKVWDLCPEHYDAVVAQANSLWHCVTCEGLSFIQMSEPVEL